MALQVWLPLNGDLKNNGLADITFTGTPKYKSTGKIGQCLDLSQRISFSCPAMANAKTYTIAFWAKVNADTTLTTDWVKVLAFYDVHPTSGTLGQLRWETCYSSTYATRGISSHNNTAYATSTAMGKLCGGGKGQWHHFTLVVSTDVKEYYDGKLAYTDPAVGGWLRGDGYFGQTNQINGELNDFRFYDHALSPKEIKEISKGLILHYKLDNSYWPYYNNLYIKPRSYDSTAYCAYQFNMMNNLEEGHTYTLQFWDVNVYHSAKTAAQTGISVYWGGGNIRLTYQVGTSYFIQTSSTNYHADYLVATFTITNAQATNSQAVNKWLNVYNSPASANGTRAMSIGAWKLSEGALVPPYSINETDVNPIEDYAKEYDCSGYGHHGSYSGSTTLAENSIRYKYCTYLPNGNTDYIISGKDIGNPSDAITMNIWFKSTCTTPGASYHELFNHATSSQYFEFAIHSSGYFRQGMVINGTRYVTNGGSNLLDGRWHMLTATYDGTSIKRYIDGIIINGMTQNVTGSLTGANGQFLFGHYGPSTTYYAKEAYISDARIYATALSAEDIQQLYQVPAIIDNAQNLYAYEFIEDTGSNIASTGIINNEHFIEQGPNSLQYDKQVYVEPDGSQWLHIFHHNNPANARFSSTDNFAIGVYLDADRWYDLEPIISAATEFEFMIKQKTTSAATETKWRWVQNINPMMAIWDDVKPGTVTFNTSSGYTNSSYGGLYYRNASSQRMCIANDVNGNWYGGIGVWGTYNGGIPGFPLSTVTTGYIDLYIRIYQKVQIHNDGQVKSNHLYEL